MKLTLEALEVLDAIDKKGSFAAAATFLHRVPSSITYTIQKCEDDLGFVLFRKVGRRSILTPAGQVLLEQGRELLTAAQSIVEKAHQVNSGWESSVNIALDTVWDIEQFLPILESFYELNTGVQVNLSEEVMGGSLEALHEGRADLVIGGPPPVSPMAGVKFQELMTSTWLFVVSKAHPLTEYPQPLCEEDTKPFPSVVIKDSSQNSPLASHRQFDKHLTLRVSSMEQKIRAIIAGIGVGFLPKHKVVKYIESGELVSLTINKASPQTIQYCSWRTSNKGKATRWFIEKVTSVYSKNS